MPDLSVLGWIAMVVVISGVVSVVVCLAMEEYFNSRAWREES